MTDTVNYLGTPFEEEEEERRRIRDEKIMREQAREKREGADNFVNPNQPVAPKSPLDAFDELNR